MPKGKKRPVKKVKVHGFKRARNGTFFHRPMTAQTSEPYRRNMSPHISNLPIKTIVFSDSDSDDNDATDSAIEWEVESIIGHESHNGIPSFL